MSEYKRREISLPQLVKGLEVNILALDTRPSVEFFRRWYENWGELETVVALHAANVITADDVNHRSSVDLSISALETLLSEELSRSNKNTMAGGSQ